MAYRSKNLKSKLWTALFFAFFVFLFPTLSSAKTAVSLVSFGHVADPDRPIDTIVLHASYNPALTRQTLAGILPLWKKGNSAPHYVIEENGTITQLVREKDRAYHAGSSILPSGEKDVNHRSIGIELLYPRNKSPSELQYTALRGLIKNIETRRTIRSVLGHDEIAPERKIDPWNFDWSRIVRPQGALTRPSFESTLAPLSIEERMRMTGVSWNSDCPVGLDDLRVVTVSYHGFDGKDHPRGRIVVHARVVGAVQSIFKQLYLASFAIRTIEPAEEYGGDDTLLMKNDVTSGFNCRFVAGTQIYSPHAFGLAIDLNPRENPSMDPALSSTITFAPRDSMAPGTVTLGDPAYRAFTSSGWKWGGTWKTYPDYQHFSSTGK